jgi:phosphatidylserine/phosphatidylglycerophosphate/cardiolipin synthase-like enzyme
MSIKRKIKKTKKKIWALYQIIIIIILFFSLNFMFDFLGDVGLLDEIKNTIYEFKNETDIYSNYNQKYFQEKKINQTIEIKSYFSPYDQGSINVFKELFNKSSSIYCAFFELKEENFLRFINQTKQKKDIVIVLEDDDKNPHYEPYIIEKSYAYMHNKFCVFDNKTVLTGSLNPTENGFFNNNENLIVFDSKDIAEEFLSEFNELKNGIYSKGNYSKYSKFIFNNMIIENYFCPEDCKKNNQNVKGGVKRIVDLINSANETLDIAIFSFTLDEIGDALIDAKNRGVKIRIILENRMRSIRGSEYQRLLDNNITIILDKNKDTMHHKFIIVDSKIVETGSYNYSNNANEKNDENIIIIYSEKLAKEYLEEFEKMFFKFSL